MGLKQGWGRETVERTGQVFEGRFRSGYKHGHGVMHYGNGDAYHGQVALRTHTLLSEAWHDWSVHEHTLFCGHRCVKRSLAQ